MPRLLRTVEQYIAERNKPYGYWIVFHKLYNEVAIHHNKKYSEIFLSDEYINHDARVEFENFMKINFPNVILEDVFDYVSLSHLLWPYLGSIAIDMEQGDAVYEALSQKYGDPFDDPYTTDVALWVMSKEDAVKYHDERNRIVEEEFGED